MARNSSIRLVYTSSELAHAWVSRKSSYGRTREGNLYFQGDTIYSYGPHFPIARLVKAPDGNDLVFFTTQSWSNTTAKHIYATRRACNHLVNIPLDDVKRSNTPSKIIKDLRGQISASWEAALKMKKWRKVELETVQRLVTWANTFAKSFNLKTKFELPNGYALEFEKAEALWEAAMERDRERMAKREIHRLEQERMSRLKLEELLPKWKNGECPTSTLPHGGDIHLRAIRGGKFIETSWGAVVPMEDALKLWRAVCTVRYTRDSVAAVKMCHFFKDTMIGDYQLNNIDGLGNVQIGCHNILWTSIEDMAKRLNLKPYDPSADKAVASAASQ